MFLTILLAVKSKVKFLADLISDEGFLPGLQVSIPMAAKRKESFLRVF